MKNMRGAILVIVSVSVLFFSAGVLSSKEPDSKTTAPPKKTKLGIILAGDTTYITGPVNADGTVNYTAYLDDKYSKGVTAENNAAIDMIKALGPDPWGESILAKLCKAMKIAPLAKDGDYFVRVSDFFEFDWEDERADRFETSFRSARTRPWKAEQHPKVAEWLKANKTPLAALAAASKKPRFHIPLGFLSPDNAPVYLGIVSLESKAPYTLRISMRALAARAMLKVQSGQWDSARADLLTIGRWAQLAGQNPMDLDRLAAMGIARSQYESIKGLATSMNLTEEQAVAILADLDSLPPLPDMREAIANERFCTLDGFMMMARTKPRRPTPKEIEAFNKLRESNDDRIDLDFLVTTSILEKSGLVDWNIVLAISNMWHDRVDSIAAIKTPLARRAACEKFERDKDLLKAELSKLKPVVDRLIKAAAQNPPAQDPPKIDTRAMSTAFGRVWAGEIVSSPRILLMMQDELAMNHQLARVALALAAEKARTGKFPAKLAALTPRYLKTIPKDIFSGKELVYKPDDSGYLLYSVGRNLRDDSSMDDDNADKDDIVVRVK